MKRLAWAVGAALLVPIGMAAALGIFGAVAVGVTAAFWWAIGAEGQAWMQANGPYLAIALLGVWVLAAMVGAGVESWRRNGR